MSINSDFFQSNMSQNKNITKIRDYIIIKRIGFGSSGLVYQVYKSNDPSKSILILKQIPFLNVSNDLEETTKKLKEAKNESLILSKLSFKYVVKYYDSFIEDDCLNIIMEYCEEGDLGTFINNLIQNNSSLSEQQVWHFFIQISLGLAYIHSNKILHRDLKPMNIFLKKNNLIKIGDLGVAKMLQTNTKALTYIGTPYYLSPEVCEGKPYNSKSDVWALGCILYELCTFKKPFNAFNQAALCMKIIQGKYIPISKFENSQKYSKNLENMINSMLKRDYMERPLMKEILNNKIFFEKAVILGYDEDIKSIYSHYNLNIKNNIFVKNIVINKNYYIDNVNDQQNSNRESNYEKKRTIPSQSRDNKMKRINSSGIYKNKSRISIQNSINNISKISKKSNSKNSCKKYKPKYKIYPSHDKKKCNSMGKNTIETSHNYNRIFGRKKEKNVNVLTTINNYQENKKKYIIPRQNSKKIMMKNNIINNINDRPMLIKCKSNFNNNISLINNNKINKHYVEKKEKSFNMCNIEEKEIIKYIHINKGNPNNNQYNFKKDFNIIKRNLISDMKELINKNDNNMSNNNVNVNKNDLVYGKNLEKVNHINKSGIKIIGIDKKYLSINKSSVNCKHKLTKKIISKKCNSKPRKIERENKMLSRKMTNDYQSSDNLLKKQKNNIEIENSINKNNFNDTQIKLHKSIINGNVINKYTSPYKLKEFKVDNNNKDNNYINTDDNHINKNMNNNYFELNNINNNKKIYNEKPKLEEIFTITKNNTSDRTDIQYLNEEFYKSFLDNSNNEINITKTEEDDDNEEKVSVLKEKNNYMKEKINQQKKEYLLKYNEYKNNILKYKNIIDIEKLFSLYELISKDKDRSEDTTKEIENYLKKNLPKEFYKQFYKLFNKFIFYDIEIGNINRLQQKFS